MLLQAGLVTQTEILCTTGAGYLHTGCPSCYPTNSVEAPTHTTAVCYSEGPLTLTPYLTLLTINLTLLTLTLLTQLKL